MRVIAGIARGRPLRSVESRLVRPTSDKVKEAIFSILEAEAFKRGVVEPGYLADVEYGDGACPWPRVLDLYAGSGALGIEALSRGSTWVDFVEVDLDARKVLADNLARTGFAGRARIHAVRVELALSTLREPYDLILLDPPYAESALDEILERLCRSELVGASTFVVLEHSRGRQTPGSCGQLDLLKTRIHGGTGISIYAARRQE